MAPTPSLRAPSPRGSSLPVRVAPVEVVAPRRPRLNGLGDPDHVIRAIGAEMMAGARGFGDVASLGLMDPGYAAVRAALDYGAGGDWRTRFNARLRTEQARDAADARHHGVARTVGQALGLAAPALVPGLGAATVGARLAGAARGAGALSRAARGQRLMAGRIAGSKAAPPVRLAAAAGAAGGVVGGLAGGAAQVALDPGASRADLARTLVAGAIGGVAGGAATPFAGPRLGGAVSGGATELLDAILDGRLPSVDAVKDAAFLGAAAGGLGQTAGQKWLDAEFPVNRPNGRWSNKKGKLGERLSGIDRRLALQTVQDTQAAHKIPGYKVGRGYTVADLVTDEAIVESKFGPRAKLSGAQEAALRSLSNYEVHSWLPRDITDFAGAGMASSALGFASPFSLSGAGATQSADDPWSLGLGNPALRLGGNTTYPTR